MKRVDRSERNKIFAPSLFSVAEHVQTRPIVACIAIWILEPRIMRPSLSLRGVVICMLG